MRVMWEEGLKVNSMRKFE